MDLGLHFAFNTEPYPDYVLHWPFDMEWSVGEGNTVARRGKIRAFLGSVAGHDLVIGDFSASAERDTQTPKEDHPKNQVEQKVRAKLSGSFRGFDYSRPRSEFFIISRDFFSSVPYVIG